MIMRDISAHSVPGISAQVLGSPEFRAAYGVKYAYCSGAMYKGIASANLVVAMANAGLMSYFGTGGLEVDFIEASIRDIQARVPEHAPYGMNLMHTPGNLDREELMVQLFFKHGIRRVEAAAYMQITRPLVRYRLKGLRRNPDGSLHKPNRVLAKVSRPEVAAAFMDPAPSEIVSQLVAAGQLTQEEAALAPLIPMADDICIEADSGGHTDQGVAYALVPAVLRLRRDAMERHGYRNSILIGAAGGIGTPMAAAAAFVMGADFIVTGSINQCTVEAGAPDIVKDMLEDAEVQDTDYAPAGDKFEMGAKVQVLRKGVFFPARANKLYELYHRHGSIDEIDEKTRKQIEEKYFKRSFADVWRETKEYYIRSGRKTSEELERFPKQKMALIFRWYFAYSTRVALSGLEEHKVDYQIQCGPALGSFNQWVKGSAIESWRNRHVADIAHRIMEGAAEHLHTWFTSLQRTGPDHVSAPAAAVGALADRLG
ncbi:PfaD family polyunsaturated fatty acid/polyketide biosynthesis protein [Trinickia sp. NRRL B-1857]|uniref:PfaD family polyunsaturated fatty acid/polyketide biosynthesis protein n=1 Tax=Trinickia sp. NRRL B-1857 TaxID=3162879 RepID=UPI003D280DEC